MTLLEYNQKVAPGRRVYVLIPNGSKVYGTACNIGNSDGTIDPGIRFDSGLLAKVTETSAYLVQMEEAN